MPAVPRATMSGGAMSESRTPAWYEGWLTIRPRTSQYRAIQLKSGPPCGGAPGVEVQFHAAADPF